MMLSEDDDNKSVVNLETGWFLLMFWYDFMIDGIKKRKLIVDEGKITTIRRILNKARIILVEGSFGLAMWLAVEY
jgi:hypothetical protein